MRTWRGWIAALVLVAAAVPAVGAAPAEPLDLDDVIRLQAAGVADDIIMSEAIVTGSVFHLTADDLIRLKEAGLSDRLIQFLVETAGSEESEPLEDPEESNLEESSDGDAKYAGKDGEYEDEATTRVYVSLNSRYSSWWYDHYWWDFWYYDCWYSPYRVSYCWGSWYPVWWSYSGCWASPYSAYRWSYDPWWNWSACSGRDVWIAYAPRTAGALSSEKWKTNRLGATASKAQNLALKSNLAARDFGRDLRIAKAPVDGKPRTERLALRDDKTRKAAVGKVGDVRPRNGIKVSAPEGGRLVDGRKDPVVRHPSKGPRPIKVRPTRPVKADGVADTPRTPKGAREVDDAPAKRRPSGEKAEPSQVRPPAKSGKPTKAPRVEPGAPPPKDPPSRAPRVSAPRPAPSSKAQAPRPSASAKPPSGGSASGSKSGRR